MHGDSWRRLAAWAVLGCAWLALGEGAAGEYLDKIWDTPDYTQTDSAFGGLPGGGGVYCGPVSVSNSMIWLADHGYPNLAPNTGNRKYDQFLVADALGSSDYMNTYNNGGTGPNDLCRGVKKYLTDHGYSYKRIQYQGWREIDAEFATGFKNPQLIWTQQGIETASAVWLNVGWYTYNEETNVYTRAGGHWITLVGHSYDGANPDPLYLIAHDPAPRAGSSFANEYVRAQMIQKSEGGTLAGGYNGLPREAFGYYKMTDGMHVSPRGDFGILDAVVVLEMYPNPGDANYDGQVDHEDAAILAEHWLDDSQVDWGDGDFNEDGRVDDRDASILAAHWQYLETRAAAVPEPSSLAGLVVLAVLATFGRLRSGQKEDR